MAGHKRDRSAEKGDSACDHFTRRAAAPGAASRPRADGLGERVREPDLPAAPSPALLAAIEAESAMGGAATGERVESAARYLADALAKLGGGRVCDLEPHADALDEVRRRLLAGAERLASARAADKDPVRLVRNLAGAIAEDVAALAPGASLLIPMGFIGGWTGSHALYGEVVRERRPEPSFTFAVYNTGEGIGYHEHIGTEDERKWKYRDRIAFEGVPATAFGRKDEPSLWLRALLEPCHVPCGDEVETYTSSDIYERLLPPPGGSRQPASPGEYFTPQRQGSCAWKVQLAVLRHALPRAAYKQVKLELRIASLLAFIRANPILAPPTEHMTREIVPTIQKAVENISRSAIKMVDAGELSAERLPELQATLAEPKAWLAAAAPEPPPRLEVARLRANRDLRLAIELPRAVAMSSGAPKVPPPAPVPPPARDTAARIRGLDAAIEFCVRSLQRGDPGEVARFIEDLVLKLPLPAARAGASGDPWRDVDPLSTVRRITQLARSYGTAALHRPYEPIEPIVMTSLAFTADRIASRASVMIEPFGFDWSLHLRDNPRYCAYPFEPSALDRYAELRRELASMKPRDLIWRQDPMCEPTSFPKLEVRTFSEEYDLITQRLLDRHVKLPESLGQGTSLLEKVAWIASDLGTSGILQGDAEIYGHLKQVQLWCLFVEHARRCTAADSCHRASLTFKTSPRKSTDGRPSVMDLPLRLYEDQEGFMPQVLTDYDRSERRRPADHGRVGDAMMEPANENSALARFHQASHDPNRHALYRIETRHHERGPLTPASAVAHALSGMNDLTNPERQWELEFALLPTLQNPEAGAALQRELRAVPALRENLKTLIHRGLDAFGRLTSELQPALFFCRLSRRLREQLEAAGLPHGLPDPEEVAWTLVPICRSAEERAAVATEHLAALVGREPSRMVLLTALRSALDRGLSTRPWERDGWTRPHEAFVHPDTTAAADKAWIALRGQIARAAEDPKFREDAGAVADGVLAELGMGRATPAAWAGRYPELRRGSITMDLSTGTLFAAGYPLGHSLPSTIRDSRPFRAVFGRRDFPARLEKDAYLVDQGNVRLSMDPDGQVAVDARLDVEGRPRWARYLEQSPDGVTEALRYDRHVWRDDGGPALIITDQRRTPVAVVEPAKPLVAGPASMGQWVRSLEHPGFVLDPHFEPPSRLCGLSPAVLLWRDPDRNALLEYPTLGLRFSLGRDERLRWSEDPRYFIAPEPARLFKRHEKYLELESDHGARKVILPRRLGHSRDPASPGEDAKVFTCTLAGGTPRATDLFTGLELAHVHLQDGNPRAAVRALRQITTASSSARRAPSLLNGTMNLALDLFESDPEVLAVIAEIAHLIARSSEGRGLPWPFSEGALGSRIVEAMALYLSLLDKIDVGLRLAPAAEALVLATWPGGMLAQRRLAHLRNQPRSAERTAIVVERHPVEPISWLDLPSANRGAREGDGRPQAQFDLDTLPILHPGRMLEAHYDDLLDVALGAEEGQKAVLRQRLALMSPEASVQARAIKAALEGALAEPERYGPVIRGAGAAKKRAPHLSELLPIPSPSGDRGKIKETLREGHLSQVGARPPEVERSRAQLPLAERPPVSRLDALSTRYLVPTTAAAPGADLDIKAVEDPVARELVEALHAHARAGEGPPTFALADGAIPRLISELEGHVRTDALARAAAELERLANEVPDDEIARARLGLEQESRRKPKITLPLMRVLFAQGHLAALAELNPSLTPARLGTLQAQLFKHLLEETDSQHAARMLAVARRLQSAPARPSGAAGTEAAGARRELAAMLAARRAYTPAENPALLVFESAADLRLRPRQVETLERLTAGDASGAPELIVQLNMGEGKTKVLLPLLALRRANGSDLALLVVPPALAAVNEWDLDQTTNAAFAQRAYRFEFDSTSDTDPGVLLARLEEARRSRQYVVTTRQSIAALKLRYLAEHERAAERKDGASQAARPYGRILDLFGRHGVALIDEADQALDVRNQINLSLGKPEPIREERRSLALELYRALVEIPGIGLLENRQSALSEAQYRAAAGKVAERVLATHPRLAPLARTPEERKALLRYVLGAPAPLPHIDEAGHLLALLREELTHLLPLTLRRNGGEHYGRSRGGDVPFAIPYARSQPVEGSQFAHPYEALNYAIQTYLHPGERIRPEELRQTLEALQRSMAAEIAQREVDFSETSAARVLAELTRGTPFAGLGIGALLEPPERLTALARAIEGSLPALFAYIERAVLPAVMHQPRQITSDGHDLVETFARVQGFTGTPWNHQTYPGRLATVPSPETDQVTLRALLDSDKTAFAVCPTPTVAGLIEGALAAAPGSDVRALIDAGAVLRHSSNASVARSLADFWRARRGSGVEAIVYYEDGTGRPLALRCGADRPINLSGTDREALDAGGLAPDRIFTYFDQAHTFGADVPLPPDATGVVTAGELTLLRDLQQGLLRLRQITNAQRCVLAVSSDLAARLGSGERGPGVADVLRHAVSNQARALGADKVTAIHQEFNAAARKVLIDATLGASSEEVASAIFAAGREILVPAMADDPLAHYGAAREVEPSEHLGAQARALAAMLERTVKALPAEAGRARAVLEAMIAPLRDGSAIDESLKARGAMPVSVHASGGNASRTEAQVTIEQEVQQETETTGFGSTSLRDKPVPIAPVNPYRQFNLNRWDPGSVRAVRSLPGGDIFDEAIHVTRALLAFEEDDLVRLFGEGHKPVHSILAVEDGLGPVPGRLKALFLSETDAKVVYDALGSVDVSNATQRATLLNDRGRVIRGGERPVSAETLASPKLQQVLLQANLMNHPHTRSLMLNPKQEAFLAPWLASGDAAQRERKRLLAEGRLPGPEAFGPAPWPPVKRERRATEDGRADAGWSVRFEKARALLSRTPAPIAGSAPSSPPALEALRKHVDDGHEVVRTAARWREAARLAHSRDRAVRAALAEVAGRVALATLKSGGGHNSDHFKKAAALAVELATAAGTLDHPEFKDAAEGMAIEELRNSRHPSKWAAARAAVLTFARDLGLTDRPRFAEVLRAFDLHDPALAKESE